MVGIIFIGQKYCVKNNSHASAPIMYKWSVELLMRTIYKTNGFSYKDMLMTIHLSHNNKLEGMKRFENILLDNSNNNNNNKYNRNKILVDHNVEETIEKTLELGLWAGLSFILLLDYLLRKI